MSWRIAATRSSSFVKNFGWPSCMNGSNQPSVDPLGMTDAAQRFQRADVGVNEGLGIAADTVDGSARPLKVLGGAIWVCGCPVLW